MSDNTQWYRIEWRDPETRRRYCFCQGQKAVDEFVDELHADPSRLQQGCMIKINLFTPPTD